MEVIVGPIFGEAAPSSSSAYVRERPQEKIPSAFFFLKREDEISGGSQDVSSVSSSSIGSSGDSDDEGEDGVVSSGTSGGFSSLGSLEDSLPIKRGLSNHYAGKSKSFANLLDVSTVKEVQKAENPFNKRRRVLLANKWCRKSSFYSWQNPNSLPLLALDEEDEETTSSSSSSSSLSNDKVALEVIKPKLQQSKLKVPFNSKSCFHLTDLEVQVEHQIQ